MDQNKAEKGKGQKNGRGKKKVTVYIKAIIPEKYKVQVKIMN